MNSEKEKLQKCELICRIFDDAASPEEIQYFETCLHQDPELRIGEDPLFDELQFERRVLAVRSLHLDRLFDGAYVSGARHLALDDQLDDPRLARLQTPRAAG